MNIEGTNNRSSSHLICQQPGQTVKPVGEVGMILAEGCLCHLYRSTVEGLVILVLAL